MKKENSGAFTKGVIASYDVSGADECGTVCFKRPDCMKATYNSDTQECTLQDSSAGPATDSKSMRWTKTCSTNPNFVDSTIIIIDASYGMNCNSSFKGNQSTNLANACNDKDKCSYTVKKSVIGDPSSSCQKDYDGLYFFCIFLFL